MAALPGEHVVGLDQGLSVGRHLLTDVDHAGGEQEVLRVEAVDGRALGGEVGGRVNVGPAVLVE